MHPSFLHAVQHRGALRRDGSRAVTAPATSCADLPDLIVLLTAWRVWLVQGFLQGL
jgi:hypothetical protein